LDRIMTGPSNNALHPTAFGGSIDGAGDRGEIGTGGLGARGCDRKVP
jgi:hypothetical protein